MGATRPKDEGGAKPPAQAHSGAKAAGGPAGAKTPPAAKAGGGGKGKAKD